MILTIGILAEFLGTKFLEQLQIVLEQLGLIESYIAFKKTIHLQPLPLKFTYCCFEQQLTPACLNALDQ